MKRNKKSTDTFLKEAQDRFEACIRADSKQRERWLEDMKFCEAADQWPESIRRVREKDPSAPRPCLTINKTQLHVRQVVNDMRQNRPQIKVLPVDNNADPKTAEILTGMIRNIETSSDADIAYDTAAHPQVAAGLGYFAISKKIADARLNHQELQIRTIWNALTVYLDPEIEHPAGMDARYGFIVEDMPEATFKAKYPDAKTVDFKEKGRGDVSLNWFPTGTTIRVAEYYYLEPKLETFFEDEEGNIYGEKEWENAGMPPYTKSRKQYVNCCYWAKLTGAEILEETEFGSQYIPIVRLPGVETVIDGERDCRGLVRDAKDPQRIYNYWTTLNTELIALGPKAPIMAPWEAIEKHIEYWQRANVDNLPFLPYDSVDANGQQIPMPQRAQPPQQSTAIVQAIMQADSDLMSVMGRFEASLGENGQEKSGRAIIARQRQGDNATYHFADNLSRALRYAGRILLDMIPKVYDTKRVARVLGEDGTSDFAELDPNQPMAMQEIKDLAGKTRAIYNVGVGRYDVTCITGPSYATRRQEAAEMMTQLSQSDPTLMQKAGDIIVKGYDLPLADDLAKRLKLFLPTEIASQEAEDGDSNDPAMMMQQAQQAAMQQMAAEVQPVMQELQGALGEAEKAVEEKDRQIAELKMQLATRDQEISARLQEAQLKADTESAKSESEIVRLVLEKALSEPEEKDDEGPSETDQAVVALTEQVAALTEEVRRPKRKQVRVNEYDAEGMPIGAEVVEVAEE